jgi:hypothetical protein
MISSLCFCLSFFFVIFNSPKKNAIDFLYQ